MDFNTLLKSKNVYRFTGPPEHWLTAIKFMTWGLNDGLKDSWAKIRPGDIFFIHSTGSNSSAFKNAKSGIIGLGVIGPDFSKKDGLLWYDEVLNSQNKWPYLVPLSEIYLFSELPAVNSWQNPSPTNKDATAKLINLLLRNSIPLGQVQGFPQMGSFSTVRPQVAAQILQDKKPLYLYTNDQEPPDLEESGITKTDSSATGRQLDEIKSADEALRYVDSLKPFESVKSRIIKEPTSQYVRDNETLDRANSAHQSILQQLIDVFRKHGYDTRSSRMVDLFAHNGKNAFLFEVKSTENSNFRTQARKGIAQLLEYDFFDVQKYSQDNDLVFDQKHKIIVPSQIPKDQRYVEFINSLKIGVAMVGEESLKPIGEDLGFSVF